MRKHSIQSRSDFSLNFLARSEFRLVTKLKNDKKRMQFIASASEPNCGQGEL